MNLFSPLFNSSKGKTKTLFLSKINSEDENIKKKINIIFEKPETYLTLSSESPIKFVVGKQIKGPRYDKNNKLISYSIVGKLNPKKTKKFISQSSSHERNSNHSFSKRYSSLHFKKNDSSKSNYLQNNNEKIIGDRELNLIFSNYKESIKINKTIEDNNSFINEIPNNLNDTVKKRLFLQEKNFLNKYKTDSFRKNLKKKIHKKIKDKDKVLLLSTSDKYREKKELSEFLSNENNYGNSVQNWAISLRKPMNFKGIRKGYYNCGNDFHPIWAQYKENVPKLFERIRNPKSFNNESFNNNFLFRTDSFDFYTKNKYKMYMNRTSKMNNLEVKGNSLLDFESKNVKLLKGRKMIHKVHYDRDSLKDLELINNWKYKGFNTIF